ncbi:MAG: peptide deformylase [Acidobacteria bacterium]|nr:peptide deformylase [Acidobacteriota bacterium]
MALRPIVVYPHPVLTRPTAEIAEVDADLRRLAEDMVETMHAEPGVGLAANQVADGRRLAVIDPSAGERPEDLLVLVNPRIVEAWGSQDGEEGCLSFPGIFENIERPSHVRYTAHDLDMKPVEATVEGLVARIICHELDHLDGVTFLQRMSPLKRRLTLRKIERLRRQGEWPESAAL